jgi:hypothetical protein
LGAEAPKTAHFSTAPRAWSANQPFVLAEMLTSDSRRLERAEMLNC